MTLKMKEEINSAEAAERLGCRISNLHYHIKHGNPPPPHEKKGRDYFYPAEELERWWKNPARRARRKAVKP